MAGITPLFLAPALIFNNAQKPSPKKQLPLTLAGKVGISAIPPSCWSLSTFVKRGPKIAQERPRPPAIYNPSFAAKQWSCLSLLPKINRRPLSGREILLDPRCGACRWTGERAALRPPASATAVGPSSPGCHPQPGTGTLTEGDPG